MTAPIHDAALDQIFREARTRNGWRADTVPETLMREIYDVAKFGPTATNASPARFVWVTSQAAKEKLAALASGTNAKKILAAPVTVIVAYDLDFAERLPELFPHAPSAKDWFAHPDVQQATAFRNGSLQGAYLLIAARALGLDAGPMSGFDNAAVDAAFFEGGRVKSNFLISLGWGTEENLHPRNPRLKFEEACKII